MKYSVLVLPLVVILESTVAMQAGQANLSVPDLSSPAARARALEENRAWLRSVMALSNDPGSDRYLVVTDTAPGFMVVDARAFRADLERRVLSGEIGSIRVSQRYFGAFRGFSWMI